MFGAQPPRPVLARLARRTGAQLDLSLGWCHYRSRKAFKAEVHRMRQWYSKPRRLARRRRGILRVGPSAAESARGRQCAFNSKLKSCGSASPPTPQARMKNDADQRKKVILRPRGPCAGPGRFTLQKTFEEAAARRAACVAALRGELAPGGDGPAIWHGARRDDVVHSVIVLAGAHQERFNRALPFLCRFIVLEMPAVSLRSL